MKEFTLKSNNNIFFDLKSGFSVFLLALPLCLGIAMASNFPPVAGIITAIVGGIVSSLVGSSRLTIKGPAAGLIVIALGAVTELGAGDPVNGYKKAIAVGVIAAALQIIFALCRFATLAEVMPPSVIHGMLSAIGVIIIAKQSHVMLGVTAQAKSPIGLLAELPNSFMNLNPEIFMIGIISLCIIFFLPKIKKLKFIPATSMVLLVTIPLSFLFEISNEHLYTFLGHEFQLGPKFLINVPSQITSAIMLPDFSEITSWISIKYILMFALVGSIESLLTVCAVDNLDPEKKKSDLNKDLLSVGIGNFIASCLGGLPMISEIVRTKANIDYGAKTVMSNFFHGLFLLLSVILLPFVLAHIPLSALAALLVFTGTRLASVNEFKKVYKIGVDQFIFFVVTLLVTLFVDLLVGVISGLALKILFHFARGVSISDMAKLNFKVQQNDSEVKIFLKDSVVFSNFLALRKQILSHPGKSVVLDFSEVTILDHTIQEKIHLMEIDLGGKLILKNTEHLHPKGSHKLSFKQKKRG
jgi:MFS superfamily sulfate permease-like transporter